MPEVNEKFKAYQNKPIGTEKLDISDESLRQYHIAIENIFDNIKSHKSARDFKWLFILLVSILLIATAIHMWIYGIGFNLIALLIIIAYWIYYRYTLKKSIEKQAIANKEISDHQSGQQDNKKILIDRTQYILNGIDVLENRIVLIRNQYVLFFPVFTMIVVDIIRGPFTYGAFIVTAIVSIILGGLFWIFYFRNDLIDLDNAASELENLQENLEALK